MRILYGVSGVGFGHSSRTMLIAKHLEEKGHQVKIMTYADGYAALKDHFDCVEIDGLEIVFEKGTVKKRETFKYNAKVIVKNLSVNKYKSLIENFKPDLCISDMESLVYRISKKFKIPLISLDNQHAFTNLKIDVPTEHLKDYLVMKGVVKGVVRKADVFIITSFYKGPLKNKNSIIVPPIIRKEVVELARDDYSGKILVYLSRGDEKILRVLKNINEEFVIFGFDENKTDENLQFKTRDHFLEDLQKCKCIFATAGFSLISEAVYLRKPYYALPLKGHFEQWFNAAMLKKSGFGEFSEEFDSAKFGNFLERLDFYKENLKRFDFDSEEVFRVLDREIENFI